MGRHKKSTKSRRANLSKTPTHKCHGVHDRAPTEAKNSTLCQWNPLRVTRSDLADLWMATVLDWTGHRLLGPAGCTMATVHCHQRLFGRPEHTLE